MAPATKTKGSRKGKGAKAGTDSPRPPAQSVPAVVANNAAMRRRGAEEVAAAAARRSDG